MSAEAMALFGPPKSSDCSPSEKSNTILVAPGRLAMKSCPAAWKPAEIEVSPCAFILSIAALISTWLVDHPTRVVAADSKDTTEKRAALGPRA